MPESRKVLIIDDEIDLGLLLREYFLRKNYDVIVANTLSQGTAMLQKYRPDILFLDNNLPDATGWTQAPSFAHDFPEMHIILISAFHPQTPEMPSNAKFQTIEKPIRFADLDKQLAKL